EVRVEIEAGPGEALFTIPRLRPEAPPEPPAVLTGWLDREAWANSDHKTLALKDKGSAWVVVQQPDGTKGVVSKLVSRAEAPDIGMTFDAWLPMWQAWATRDRKQKPFRTWYTALAEAAHLMAE